MYFFWFFYCICMLTMILRLSIQMRLALKALASSYCLVSKTSALRQELFPSWFPVGYRKKTVKCLFWL